MRLANQDWDLSLMEGITVFLLYLSVSLFLFLCQRQEYRKTGKSRILIEYFPLKG